MICYGILLMLMMLGEDRRKEKTYIDHFIIRCSYGKFCLAQIICQSIIDQERYSQYQVLTVIWCSFNVTLFSLFNGTRSVVSLHKCVMKQVATVKLLRSKGSNIYCTRTVFVPHTSHCHVHNATRHPLVNDFLDSKLRGYPRNKIVLNK